MNRILVFLIISCSLAFFGGQNENADAANQGLIGSWKLSGNAIDNAENKLHPKIHGLVNFDAEGREGPATSAAYFDGRGAWLEIPAGRETQLGDKDFSIATWIYTGSDADDVPGDILSQYDPVLRKGFHLSLKGNVGITSHANYKQLTFGIDDNHSSEWIDCGKPGNALMAFALADYKGGLYAGICETGADESGHVYRYANGKKWVNCGAPDRSNSVTALAVFNEELYAGTGKYRVAGSSLPESSNTTSGGRIFRYSEPDKWIDCGYLPDVVAIGGMAVFNGKLYASSLYSPGFYRYEGNKQWVACDLPQDNKRVVGFAVHDGYLYATNWDIGHVYRYDGKRWEDCGRVGNNTQTYAFAVYEGGLFVATWPSGRVFRFDGLHQWTDVGRLGNELEVMGMLTHNGRMIGGTLPLAEVYCYEGDTTWTRMDQLDRTPDVKYRRAWAMAEQDGKVFCSTLPSGKIFSYEAGRSVTSKTSIEPGWQHVAAVKTSGHLRLFVNGKLVNEKPIPDKMKFNLDSRKPLKIGYGSNDYFSGRISDLRLYNRALKGEEIQKLAERQ